MIEIPNFEFFFHLPSSSMAPGPKSHRSIGRMTVGLHGKPRREKHKQVSAPDPDDDSGKPELANQSTADLEAQIARLLQQKLERKQKLLSKREAHPPRPEPSGSSSSVAKNPESSVRPRPTPAKQNKSSKGTAPSVEVSSNLEFPLWFLHYFLQSAQPS